jgi:hypothetical protein
MTHPNIEAIRALIPDGREKINGLDWLNWNDMSELGLIVRINNEILHPLGLSLSRNPGTGASEAVLIAPDGKWEYSTDITRAATSQRPVPDQRGAKWILTSEGLPPVNTSVFAVYLDDDSWRVGCGCLSSGHPMIQDGWYTIGLCIREVLCWMPMPAIPIE